MMALDNLDKIDLIWNLKLQMGLKKTRKYFITGVLSSWNILSMYFTD